MNNTALLLIEFQNEWLSDQGKLNHLIQDKKDFACSVTNARKVLDMAREEEMCIIHSGLSFNSEYDVLGKAKHGLRAAIKKNKTFVEDSSSSQFYPSFMPKKNEFIVQGRVGSSAFSGSNLDAYLRNNNIQRLYIMGYALHVCVESTLRAGHDLGYEVTVIIDACSAFTLAQKEYFCSDTIHHFGASIHSDYAMRAFKINKQHV